MQTWAQNKNTKRLYFALKLKCVMKYSLYLLPRIRTILYFKAFFLILRWRYSVCCKEKRFIFPNTCCFDFVFLSAFVFVAAVVRNVVVYTVGVFDKIGVIGFVHGCWNKFRAVCVKTVACKFFVGRVWTPFDFLFTHIIITDNKYERRNAVYSRITIICFQCWKVASR